MIAFYREITSVPPTPPTPRTNIPAADISLSRPGPTSTPIKPLVAPEPTTETVKLQFSVFGTFLPVPSTIQPVHAEADGSFVIEFTLGNNISNVSADNGEMWIKLCNECSYVEEPEGFTQLKGMDRLMRYKRFDYIRPGIWFERMAIKMSVAPLTIWAAASSGSGMADEVVKLVPA